MTRRASSPKAAACVGRRDRGATVVELALLMPVLLIVILLVVQSVLWFHGRQVADAAAREGARLARAAGASGSGWQGQAEARALQVVRAIGPRLLAGAKARAWEQGGERGVEVTGGSVSVIPLLPRTAFTITSRFGGPVECFRPDDGSGACG
ncbi:TadE/TadG family type IV pilus assembly protein [Sphaerisporangium sp. NPDC088356]|uniref:TadE/TadG family type IV pilus assembly protein n=1 Tax=Sphaerisporangium sp. NPDC088356 TaxID=3154871 RepID=UPI003423326E